MADERTYTSAEVDQMVSDRLKTGKYFSQDQVNAMISDRLKREKDTLEAYKAQMAREAAAQAEADAMRERFTAALGDRRKVIHPRLTDLMIGDFTKAVNDPANQGKSDDEIFAALFSDGYIVPKDYPRFGTSALPRPGNDVSQTDAIRQAFGLKG